jgi:hypothetical protein
LADLKRKIWGPSAHFEPASFICTKSFTLGPMDMEFYQTPNLWWAKRLSSSVRPNRTHCRPIWTWRIFPIAMNVKILFLTQKKNKKKKQTKEIVLKFALKRANLDYSNVRHKNWRKFILRSNILFSYIERCT